MAAAPGEGGRDRAAIERSYDELFATGRYREIWEGRISLEYKLPKYLGLIAAGLFGDGRRPSVLEVGAGDGEIAAALLAANPGKAAAYTVTELTAAGTAGIRRRLEAVDAGDTPVAVRQMDATRLDFPDASFDAVCAFDVMHHLDEPLARQMAREMTRVARRQVFLVEANAFSLPRRLMECTPRYRSTGEGSYYPWEYRRFFLEGGAFRRARIKPFLFMFPHIAAALIRLNVGFSEALERLPLVRWQCSSVLLDFRK